MFQYSPILGRSSIWDLKYTFSDCSNPDTILSFYEIKNGKGQASLRGKRIHIAKFLKEKKKKKERKHHHATTHDFKNLIVKLCNLYSWKI